VVTGSGSDETRWRRAKRRPALLIVVVLAALFVASRGHGWLIERGHRDEVAVSGTVRVSAASTSPLGGSVNYAVAVRNVGPQPIQVTQVDISHARLRVTTAGIRPLRLAPDETGEIAVSVRLDCTRGEAFHQPDGLQATVVAVPLSGKQHSVSITFEQANLLTDVANTLCRVRPALSDEELSGPVLEK
jgi:hypothetical protein